MSEEENQILVCFHRDENGMLSGRTTRYQVPTKRLDEFWWNLRNDYVGIEECYPYVFNESILKTALSNPLKDYFEGESEDDQKGQKENK